VHVELTSAALRSIDAWCGEPHAATNLLIDSITGVRMENVRSAFEVQFFRDRSLAELDALMRAALYFDIEYTLIEY
jgi:hypothetical protein